MPSITINRTNKGLIFLSAVCGIFILARIILKDDMKYSFLLWNLFLAWIPLFLAQLAYYTAKKNFLASAYAVLFCGYCFFRMLLILLQICCI